MASSKNRFDALARLVSSSKEPEAQHTDQIMGATPKAGPSGVEGIPSMSGLEDTLLKTMSMPEAVALFNERGAAMAAEQEERKKKLRQSNSAMIVGEPISSAAPSQGPRKRTAPLDGAKELSKRPRGGSLPPNRSGEPATAAPTTVSDSETQEPDIATQTSPSAPALLVPEAAILAPPVPFRWTEVRNPRKPLPCIIQVNYSSRVGSFDEDGNPWAFQVTLDAGRRGTPKINMDIFSNGIAGPQRGRTGWCLGDYIEDDWMVTDFKFHRVLTVPMIGGSATKRFWRHVRLMKRRLA